MDSEFDSRGQLDLIVPKALRRSHEELRDGLVRAATIGGPIGKAATRINQLCLSHFWHEERTVFPALSLLPDLEQGNLRPEMKDVLPLISEFRVKRPALADHHQSIVAAIDDLLEAACREHSREMVDFAYALQLHERIEDEVVYPTVAFIGRYLERLLGSHP